MKAPGIDQDIFEARMPGLPAQNLQGSGTPADQLGGISRAARRNAFGNRMPGDPARGFDQLSHRVSATRTQIAGQALGSRLKACQGTQVGVRQVNDMDIVSNASAIGRWVVIAEDPDLLALAQGDLKHQGNQMGFGSVVFAQIALGRRASGVEIAKRRKAKPIGMGIVLHHVLHVEFRSPVGVDGNLGIVLGQGQRDGNPVGGASRRKDQFLTACVAHGFEQIPGVDHVFPIIDRGILHRLPHITARREVHYRARLPAGEGGGQRLPIGQTGLDHGRPNGLWVSGREVVKDHHGYAPFLQGSHGMASDITRPADHQNGARECGEVGIGPRRINRHGEANDTQSRAEARRIHGPANAFRVG